MELPDQFDPLELSFDLIEKEIADGYINFQDHESGELRILNYSQKTQYDWRWTTETLCCRGLIVDRENRIVARPFPKFFSYEQLGGNIPDEPFKVYDKLDGSMGILYWHNDQAAIATRGAFASPQAIRATKMLKTTYSHVKFEPALTYLFEIIFPGNRIVVDYQDRNELVLLGIIETATGIELPLEEIGMPIVERFDGLTDFDSVLQQQHGNREGFVIRFESGQRVKVKFEEYTRLHKMLTGLNERSVWEMLRNGDDIKDRLEDVPDEMFAWIEKTEAAILSEYNRVEVLAKSEMRNDFKDRREAAEYFQTCTYPSLMFAMSDQRDISDKIWKLVRPDLLQTFPSHLNTMPTHPSVDEGTE